jgi:hypothetical protein
MASITITTTAQQDQVLLRIANRYNAEKRAADPAWVDLTPAQWFRDVVIAEALRSYVRDALQDDSQTVRSAWETATQAQKDQVKQVLGVT